jgi:hypothetical protein
MLLLDWNHSHKNSTVVIVIWLSIMKYQMTMDFFLFRRRFFLSSITNKIFTRLYLYNVYQKHGGYLISLFFVCLIVFNANFNNISVISWRSVLLVEETGGPGENHRPVASHCKLYHIMLYTSPWSRFELATSVVIGTDCIGSCKSNYHTITVTTTPILYWEAGTTYPGFILWLPIGALFREGNIILRQCCMVYYCKIYLIYHIAIGLSINRRFLVTKK